MNLVNRILVVFELVVLVIVSLVCITLLLVNRLAIKSLITPLLDNLSAQTINAYQVVLVGIMTLALAFAILLLLLEFQRPAARRLRIQSIQGAEVLLTADAITQQLEYTLEGMTDVIRARAQVVSAGKDKGVDVFIEMWTTPTVDVKAKTEEAAGVARQVIEDKLGLKVGRVQIKLDQMKAPAKRGAVVTKPAGSIEKV